ncbi:MAG: AgmX/PglI C-terminal domain-containing protein [Deltaproteobacteria bacterium]|nr:AgmX/PglI C-terminal domain-containing protein [Deltaproteobacteria bacterium]
MRFICEKCHTKYSIADEKVRGKVLKIRCKKCHNIIVVREPASKAKSALKKKDQLDEEFERAFDRLTGKSGIASRPESKAAKQQLRVAPDLKDDVDAGIEGEEWFAILRGRQIGPMNLDEVKQAIKDERISHGTYLWRDGMADWVRAARCDEIKPLLPDRRIPKAQKPSEVKSKPEKEKAGEPEEDKTRIASPELAAELARKLESQAQPAESQPEETPRHGEPEVSDEKAVEQEEVADRIQDQKEEIPERRASEEPGIPPPMPDEDEEILIAPAITGKLITLKAAIAMSIASAVIATVATALIIELTRPRPRNTSSNENAQRVTKVSKRKKIILTPELLALKSKLFGQDGSRRSRRGRRSGSRPQKKTGHNLSISSPTMGDSNEKPSADLAATFKNAGMDLDQARGSRGTGTATGGVAMAASTAGSPEDGLADLSRKRRSDDTGSDGLDLGSRRKRTSLRGMNTAGLPEGLPPETVASHFQGMWIETCYNRALKRDPSMKGKMIVEFEIRNDGRVYSVRISPSTFLGTFLAKCFSREIKKIRFPMFRGDPIPIEYPFLLSAH